jgi:hypothetical protein
MTQPTTQPTTLEETDSGVVEPQAVSISVMDSGPARAAQSEAAPPAAAVTEPEPLGAADIEQDAATPTAVTMPACQEAADPGPFNLAGSELGASQTWTDWTLPAPAAALVWTTMIEQDVPDRDAGTPPVGGYYWHQLFSFVAGVAGRFGFQTEGVYDSDPTTLQVDAYTKMAVFWLSGPPLKGELGDIPFPDARVATENAAGLSWLSIHARFEWQVCHVYRQRFAPHSTEADGAIWYGMWIEDLTSQEEVFLGRMLLPADTGPISPFMTTATIPFDFVPQTSCDMGQPVSAVFGAPMDADTGEVASHSTDRFVPRCASSRFTDFERSDGSLNAVRHELAVPR